MTKLDKIKYKNAKNAGRPEKYKEEYISKVDDYLAGCKDEYSKVVKQFNEAKGYEMYDNVLVVKLPTIEGFCEYINTPWSTLHDWMDRHVEFSDAIDKIKLRQKRMLIENGLAGTYNSTITKLILGNNHGVVEQSKSELTHKGLSSLLTEADKEEDGK